jgi:Ca-activated chloride channel homolog
MKALPLAVVAALAMAGSLVAQDAQPLLRNGGTFRSTVEITTITATVFDSDGRLVTGLPREAFTVFEDGDPQQITHFTGERVPLSLGLVLDISDSMFGTRPQEARGAVGRFLFELLDPTDEFFVEAFNHRPHVLTGWTRDGVLTKRTLDSLLPSGGTAAYDAVIAALPMFTSRGNQRAAALLISDGADTASDAALRDVRSALLRSEAFLYAIAIDSPGRQAINAGVNPQALRELTDPSGGRTEVVTSTAGLVTATARIAEELNSQYLLGYSSSRAADGQYHSIRVRMTDPSYRVRARNGYVAAPRRQTP